MTTATIDRPAAPRTAPRRTVRNRRIADTSTAETPGRAAAEDLADWNARVRRLALDYAPKYRPVFFPIAYHTNLGEGRSWPRVETIARESARYRQGKPLSARQVKRLISEMENAGAVESEARFSRDTGRQRSSYRRLVTSVAVNRYGYSVPHDFHAPLSLPDEGCHGTVTERLQANVTPHDTPRVTPHDTPITSYELDREHGSHLSDSYGVDPPETQKTTGKDKTSKSKSEDSPQAQERESKSTAEDSPSGNLPQVTGSQASQGYRAIAQEALSGALGQRLVLSEAVAAKLALLWPDPGQIPVDDLITGCLSWSAWNAIRNGATWEQAGIKSVAGVVGAKLTRLSSEEIMRAVMTGFQWQGAPQGSSGDDYDPMESSYDPFDFGDDDFGADIPAQPVPAQPVPVATPVAQAHRTRSSSLARSGGFSSAERAAMTTREAVEQRRREQVPDYDEWQQTVRNARISARHDR